MCWAILVVCAVTWWQSLVTAHLHQAESALAPTFDPIPYNIRVYWMRKANEALSLLSGPCPFGAFGTAIVNHTANAQGELVCIGINENSKTGNPTMHGELAAIDNCTAVLTDPAGKYRLNASQALAAFEDLSLYTNAESCPMCASAIRWAGFKEYIYGTSIKELTARGWSQINISSREVFRRSAHLPSTTRLVAHILTNETNPYFSWQFDPEYPCPMGCSRVPGGGICVAD